MTNQKKAYFFTALSIFFWSTVATAFKLTLRRLDYIQLLFYSSLFSTIALFIALLLQGKMHILKTQTKKDILLSARMGLINPVSYYLVLFKAYAILPAQEAQALNYTWPIALSLLSVPLLKQKLSKKVIIAFFISFCGVLVISTKGNLSRFQLTNLLGDFLAVLSSVIWAFYWIFNLRDKRDTTIKLFMAFLFAMLYMTLLFIRNPIFPDFNLMLGAAYVGFFEMGLTFLFWLKALAYSRNTASVANFIYIAPFLSLFFISVFVGEKILLSSIFGLMLIVGGIMFKNVDIKM